MSSDVVTIKPRLLERLRRLGVTVGPVREELTTDEYFALWRGIAGQDLAPDLGLRFGASVPGESASSSAALQAATVGDALRTIARYKRLSCPEEVVLEVRDGVASVRCDWVLATGPVPPILVDAVFAMYVALIAIGTAGAVAPIRIELARKRQGAQVLRDHFRCPIVFGAAADRIVLDARALGARMVTADHAAYERLVPGLEARLAGRRSLIGDVRVAIARTISAGARPSVQTIAGRLHTSPRTLQRRLGVAHTSFQDQLDDVRRAAARRLLEHTTLSPIDISFLLGFAEPNSFARAFRSWERTSPLRWRAARA